MVVKAQVYWSCKYRGFVFAHNGEFYKGTPLKGATMQEGRTYEFEVENSTKCE